MLPLYEDPWFTFRFADDRLIPRFHLEGVPVGRPVAVFQVDSVTGERLGLLARGTVGADGWVDLPTPIIVRAGQQFIAVPEPLPQPLPEAEREAGQPTCSPSPFRGGVRE